MSKKKPPKKIDPKKKGSKQASRASDGELSDEQLGAAAGGAAVTTSDRESITAAPVLNGPKIGGGGLDLNLANKLNL